jgi:hypothetical protein
MAIAFDTVVIDKDRTMTADEFMALSLRARVAIIIDRSVVFMRANQVIERKVALGSLIPAAKNENGSRQP